MGWFNFQPLYEMIVHQEPDLLDWKKQRSNSALNYNNLSEAAKRSETRSQIALIL
jgi:ABC-type nitrate/sulfonate/bicarbonate transport system ATPase subunit